MSKVKIAIFASGQGSNALNIIEHFKNHPQIEVGFVLSNRSDANVLIAAEKRGVPTFFVPNGAVEAGAELVEICRHASIDFIVLAGFLRKIPACLIASFPNRIMNIHPALLPKFGGAGMYGKHVHEAVFQAREVETGITIHFVNEVFDAGRKLAQFHCRVEATDTVNEIQQKVQLLEHMYFPVVIEKTILNYTHV